MISFPAKGRGVPTRTVDLADIGARLSISMADANKRLISRRNEAWFRSGTPIRIEPVPVPDKSLNRREANPVD